MQDMLTHEIDEQYSYMYADKEQKKDQAEGFAEHEVQQYEYVLLELQHARDLAWEWIAHGGVGDRGWRKHLGGGGGGSGGGSSSSNGSNSGNSGGSKCSKSSSSGGTPRSTAGRARRAARLAR